MSRIVRSAAPVLPVLVALATFAGACSDDGGESSATTAAPSTSARLPTSTSAATTPTTRPTLTTQPVEDFVATADDFPPLRDMTPVRGFFIANPLGHLDEALAVAKSPTGGEYPVGTIIQLIPQEAMVKRAPGFRPEFGDWEFFELDVSAEGTEIHQRGGAEIVNRVGLSCASCHEKAEPQWDFVCEKDHGCDPLPFGDDVITGLQDGDPRPSR